MALRPFAVDDDTFDAILDRVKAADLPYSADPRHRQPGVRNTNNDGRWFYVQDPNGHHFEFLTRPITANLPAIPTCSTDPLGREDGGGALGARPAPGCGQRSRPV